MGGTFRRWETTIPLPWEGIGKGFFEPRNNCVGCVRDLHHNIHLVSTSDQ